MYYVVWLNEEDIDKNTIGGAVAYRCHDEAEAIKTAKALTIAGRPCMVEHIDAEGVDGFVDTVWEPEET